ncbi:MAG TPA: NADH-quinone oxidoreductase subunit C [Candidatus Acidoferrales bacterium]|nr:NADH-quinone oxidoreductase subunit C [Candidatus Acidoferrales bacterium]
MLSALRRMQPIETMANDPSEKTPAPKPPADPPKAAAEGASVSPKTPAEGAATPPKPAAPAKPAAPGAPAAAAPPKPPAAPPPPKEGPTPLDNELIQRLKARFGDAIKEATQDRKQAIVLVAADQLREISRYCRDEEKFDMLDDLTAVDWPKREKRFDVVLILYSFPKNERLRLKAHAAETEPVPSLCEIWPVANWLERECFDMFGIVFEGHPDLKRILMPDEWQGHPLRKDYDILKQDTAWVRENLGIESGQ